MNKEEYTQMKKLRTRLLALCVAVVMVLGLSGAALAAEGDDTAPESAISVQLDGENLTFTDAVPQVKDQRTFLPFRAVFEAMGAEVSNEGNVITAVRDGKTLTMTIGSTEASLTEGDVTTAITMDVAPYVDSATWRTYVPVRFAAQAFGCAVGWDAQTQTAVIVDVESVVKEALEPYHFTYLDKYMAYTQQFQEGNWAASGKLDGTVTIMQSSPLTLAATYEGISTDGTAVEMTMNMTMDMEQFLADMVELAGGSMDELTESDKALLDSLSTEGLTFDIRGDLMKGEFYFSMSGAVAAAIGLPENTWIAMDMNALLEGSGMDWATLMASVDQTSNLNLDTLLSQALAQVPVDDSTTAYTTIKSTVEQVAKLLADESFVKDGNDYTTTFTAEESGLSATLAVTFTMENDAVVGYKADVALDVDAGDAGQFGVKITESVDKDNHSTATITLDGGVYLSMDLTMTGDYTTTDEAPELTPPEGANVIDLVELINSAATGSAESEPAPETAA